MHIAVHVKMDMKEQTVKQVTFLRLCVVEKDCNDTQFEIYTLYSRMHSLFSSYDDFTTGNFKKPYKIFNFNMVMIYVNRISYPNENLT